MITYKDKPNNEKELFEVLHPIVKSWFSNKFKSFSLPQLYGVMEVHSRNNVLISAPTGATKTLTGFMAIINELIDSSIKGIIENKVYCVYVSPLKALNNDIQKNLLEPLEEMEKLYDKLYIDKVAKKNLGIRVAVRTGDTTQKEKSDMLKNPPHILITTPESLAILLNSPKFKDYLRDVQWGIIDEIHALADNKRGVHLSISLEILQQLSFGMTRIGLSATISPLEEIARFLVGDERGCRIIDIQFLKELDLKVLSPVDDLIDTTHSYMHHEMYKLLDKLIQEHKTTLIFTNTRSGTERVVHYLKDKFPKNYMENIGAHHGSLSKDHRLKLEERLRNGELKVVVSSTSLELGIDIGYIDLVILLGSPKSVARALQRCLPYNSRILTETGEYVPIGEIVESKLPLKIISYDEEKGFIANKIVKFHKNNSKKLINIKLKCGEEIECTEEHPLLTNSGWKQTKDISKNDKIAEVNYKINFKSKIPYIYELLPKNKVYVVNKDNYYEKIISEFTKKKNITLKEFSEKYNFPYSRLIDCRRMKGRRKSIRLDYFLEICNLSKRPLEEYLPYLKNLKSKGGIWSVLPLKPTKELMWLTGVIATDGSIVRYKIRDSAEYYKIKIGMKSKEMIREITNILKSLNLKVYSYERNGIVYIDIGSNILAYIFMKFGIKSKDKTRNVEVGNEIFKMSPELIHAYLEGIFEGDGNFSQYIRIFSASKKFIYGLHKLLRRFGYHNTISKQKSKPSKLIKKVNNINIYCINLIRKQDTKRFFENCIKIGEKTKKSFNIIKCWKINNQNLSQFNKFIYWSDIEEIKKSNKRQIVYNLTLEKDPNNFIVDNVIAHNCGRAGHQLHSVTKGRIVVLDRDDLVECSLLLKSAIEKKIDKIHIPTNALDVLSQQIFGIAISEQTHINDLFNLIKKSYCYKTLNKKDFNEVIDYLAGKYISLEDRHIYAKIWYDEETGVIGKKGRLARVLYMTNIGTIPDESHVKVKVNDHIVGTIDEAFLERLRRGDIFVLGGNTYEFKFSRGMVAQVQASINRPPTVPSWFSDMLPLSFDLALEIQKFRKLMEQRFNNKYSKEDILEFIHEYLYLDEKAANAIYNYFDEQFRFSEIPHEQKIIVENYTDEENRRYVVFHTLFGRRVNDVLSRALAYAIYKTQHRDVELGINDNGFYLAYEKNVNVIKAFSLLNSKDLRRILELAIDQTEVLKRRFRHCAMRALMILRTYKGKTKKVGRQQVSSMILLNAVKRISEQFIILKEARREVLEDLMDIENAIKVLKLIEDKKIRIKEVQTRIPSPFALNLVMQGYADILKADDKIEFLKKMHQQMLAKISLKH